MDNGHTDNSRIATTVHVTTVTPPAARCWIKVRRTGLLDRDVWLWLLVALLVVLLAADLVRVWRITNHHDLDVFLLAASRLVKGEDIFADSGPFVALIESGTFSMKDDSVAWPYMYAPLIAILFVPALWLPYAVVQAGWWACNVLALLLGGWLCLKSMGRATPGALVLVLLILYCFEPAIVALRLGQIEILQFLLLAVTLYALSRGDVTTVTHPCHGLLDRWAGIALGLATGLKFFPGALVVLLLWRRRWRAAGWAIGVAAITIIGSFALVGFDSLTAYLKYTSIYGIGGAFAAFPLNQSLNGFFSRNLTHNVFGASLKGVHLPGLAKALTLACDALIVIASAWLTWHRQHIGTLDRGGDPKTLDTQRFNLEFGLAVVALLLMSPHSQVYTFVWILLPLIVLALWLVTKRLSWWRWALLFVIYLLLGRNYILYQPGLTRFFQSHYLFGALFLWLVLACILFRYRYATQLSWRTYGGDDEGQIGARHYSDVHAP